VTFAFLVTWLTLVDVEARELELNIETQPIRQAILALADAAQIQAIFITTNVTETKTVKLVGTWQLLSALETILADTRLEYEFLSEDLVIIRPRETNKFAGPLNDDLRDDIAGVKPGQDPTTRPVSIGLQELENIIVTGSRLVRRDLVSSSPLVVISEDDIFSSGNVTLEQTLNEYPQLQGNVTSSDNAQAGAGVLTADLRGLGPERTLVLVNGRRFVPGDIRGVVDLASIPDALIDRIEIVTGGASAVYGSDAIAGVVNIILKDDFEGIEARAVYGETWHGDADRHKVDLTIGSNFSDDRGNVTLHLSYTDQATAFFEDRDFSAVQLVESGSELVPGGSTSIPGTLILLNSSQLSSMNLGTVGNIPGDCDIRGIRFGENGAPLPYCNPQDSFNFSTGQFLIRPLERVVVTGTSSFDIAENTTAYGEGFYQSNQNAFQQAAHAFIPESASTPGVLQVPDLLNNPLLFPSTRDFFADNADFFDADGDGTFSIVNSRRRTTEIGYRTANYERNSYQGTAGLKGDVSLGGNEWLWDTYFSLQRTTQSLYMTGFVSNARLGLGLDAMVDPVTGDVSCRQDLFDCVPVSIFGLDSISSDMVEFLTPALATTTEVSRNVFAASVTGDLFNLPAGPIPLAFGVEWREEQFDFMPGGTYASGESTGGDPNPPNSGRYHVAEVLGETRIPIIRDAPMLHDLSIEAGIRWSDYSSVGDVLTWKAGVEWAPVEWLRFRGLFQRAARAPNLIDLFDTQSAGFVNGTDPCANNPTDAEKQLCIQQGISPDVIDNFQQADVGFQQVSGGNPDLENEASDTLTFGAVISLPVVEGLNIAVDYYDVKVNDAISTINAQLVVDECFRRLDISSEFCQRISRFPDGQMFQVESTLVNVAELKVEGIDLQLDYTFDLPEALSIRGDDTLTVRLNANWQFKDEITALADSQPVNCAGHFAGPCSGAGVPLSLGYKALLNATWKSGATTARAQFRQLGDLTVLEGQTAFTDSIDTQTYFDLGGTYQFTENYRITLGVDNVFDKQPPLLGFRLGGPPNTVSQTYDLLGRRFIVAFVANFR
jgi:outer membrane receptor protein involved in Fe transport